MIRDNLQDYKCGLHVLPAVHVSLGLTLLKVSTTLYMFMHCSGSKNGTAAPYAARQIARPATFVSGLSLFVTRGWW